MSEWKDVENHRPPYFELVQLKLDERIKNKIPFTHGALLPGLVFDEKHEDFWVDSTLDINSIFKKDVLYWKETDSLESFSPVVKFKEEKGHYWFEFAWMLKNKHR